MKKTGIAALLLLVSFMLPFFSFAVGAATILDLAMCSERYLSDFALADGGSVISDADGNVIFTVSSARHNLKFKCTGASVSGEQNAICIWINNRTGSTKIYVDLVFMDSDGKQKSISYIKDVENSGSDVYLFVPSGEDEYVVSISLRAAGVSEGVVTVMGIWHCYYYFASDRSESGIGSIDELKYINSGTGVLIEGTLLYDILIAYPDSMINIYRIGVGESLTPEFVKENEPVASSKISRSFSFTLKNKEASDFTSSYAVTISAEDGTIERIIEDKRYPTAQTEDATIDSFKGVSTSLEYLPTEMAMSSLVIDVDIDLLLGSGSSGYLYSFGGKNYCFSGNVTDRIRRRIASHTADGGTVYIKITKSSVLSTPAHMHSRLSFDAAALYATLAFLSSTYADDVAGFIIGNTFDTPYADKSTSTLSFEEYIESYSDMISVAYSAVKNTNPEHKVILPVSSNNVVSADEYGGSDSYPMFSMLISLFERFGMENDGVLTLMICDKTFPDIEANLRGDINSDNSDTVLTKSEIMKLSCENVRILERLIAYLKEKYRVCEEKYLYSWAPQGFKEVNELALAYAYNYLCLSGSSSVYTFICDFSDDEATGDYRKPALMLEALSKMGSVEGKVYADALLSEYTDLKFDGLAGYDSYSPRVFTVESLGAVLGIQSGIRGSASMVNISSAFSLSGWKNGVYSESLSIVSGANFGRAVRTTMHLPENSSEFSEIIYSFGRNIDLSAIKSVVARMIIGDEGEENATSSVYKLKIALGSEVSKGVFEYTVDVKPGSMFDIRVDTSSFEGMDQISYIKVSVGGDGNRELALRICDIKAESSTLSSDEVAELFENKENAEGTIDTDSASKGDSLWLLILFFFVFSALSIAGIILIKKGRFEEM